MFTENGKPLVSTIRKFVDREIAQWLKESPDGFKRVDYADLVDDMRANYANSEYVKVFGWSYYEAVRVAETSGAVFVLICHPLFQARFYDFLSVRDDDEYAFVMVDAIYKVMGGEIRFEEYDPDIHVEGFKFGPNPF